MYHIGKRASLPPHIARHCHSVMRERVLTVPPVKNLTVHTGHIRRPKQKRGERGRFLPGEWDVYERPVCKGQALADQQADVAEGQVGTDGGFSADGEQAE